MPHVRLPARAGAADQDEPDQGRRPGQRDRRGGKSRAGRTAGHSLKKVFNKPDIEIKAGYLNNLELRCNNELARHKLLDLLGDFALLGVRIKGRVWATRPGHFANTEFMKQLKQTIRSGGEKPRYTYDCRKPPLYDINDIRRMLPHRPPFLLVDRIFHCDSTRPWRASRT